MHIRFNSAIALQHIHPLGPRATFSQVPKVIPPRVLTAALFVKAKQPKPKYLPTGNT